MTKPLFTKAAALGCMASLFSSCLVHQPPAQPQPVIPARPAYIESTFATERKANADNATADLPVSWWTSFQDSTLNELMSKALASNLGLQQLTTRIDQAKAALDQAGGQLFPQVDADGVYQSRWEDGFSAENRTEAVSFRGLLQWEADVWGRLRSIRHAEAEEVEVAEYDLQAARLLLSASVAETYFQILEQEQQLELVQRQIEVNETLLDLTRLRFGQALASIVDVLQQQEQLDATRALVPGIESRRWQLEYTMDLLLGQAPEEARVRSEARLKVLPPAPSPGVPSDLLRNRPDLLALQHRMTALDYRVGEAIADRLPRFILDGSLGISGNPGLDTVTAALGGLVTGPVFDAGVRRAEVRRRRAILEEAILVYSETYLDAVREVETALVQEEKKRKEVALLARQLGTSQRLLTETQNRYTQGLTDYLPVLDAVQRQQNLERQLLTRHRELLSLRVTLHRALGGPMSGTYFGGDS